MLFLTILSVAHSYLSQKCVEYNCADTDVLDSTEDQCVYLDKTYQVSPCDDGLHCEVPAPGQTGYCLNTLSSTDYSYPGEPCSDTQTCLYGSCNSKVCEGLSKDKSCTKTQECDQGLSCQSGKCKTLLEIDDTGCYNDYDCVNNAGCSTTNSDGSGKCIEYFSVSSKKEVETCFGNKNLLCESGVCAAYGDGYVCLPSLKNSLSSPYSCDTDDYCYSEKDDFTGISLTGKCGCSLVGKSFCSLFPGDLEANGYQEYSRAWVQTKEIHECHSVRRFDEDCISQKWDSKKDTYLYNLAVVRLYNQVEKAQDCLIEVFFADYSEAQEAYEVSFGAVLGLGSLFLLS